MVSDMVDIMVSDMVDMVSDMADIMVSDMVASIDLDTLDTPPDSVIQVTMRFVCYKCVSQWQTPPEAVRRCCMMKQKQSSRQHLDVGDSIWEGVR